MAIEIADVESPQHGSLDLGPAFPADLVDIGVIPQICDRPREPAIPVQQGRGLGDRTPSVPIELGVESELYAHIVASKS